MATIHFTRPQLNKEIFFLSKRLSPEGEERFQFEQTARTFFPDLPEELHISKLTDSQAKTIYIALKSLESGLKSGLKDSGTAKPTVTEKPASDGQIRGIVGIISNRYGNDYKAITTALKNYCPVIVAKLNLKEGKNIYMPNFLIEIKKSWEQADKLIKRFDAIKAGERKNEK